MGRPPSRRQDESNQDQRAKGILSVLDSAVPQRGFVSVGIVVSGEGVQHKDRAGLQGLLGSVQRRKGR